MRHIINQHTISFRHAFDGLVWAFQSQPNFRIHILCASIAVILGIIFQITYIEWIIIIFTIVLGISGELINTSIEAVTDLVTQEWRKEAKIAKDVSAGMMLCIAIGAILVGIILFTPYILRYVVV